MNPIQIYQQSKGLKPDGVIGKITLAEIKKDCNIATDIQLAHFMGQCHHETGGFRVSSENLNYTTAESITRIFRHDFDTNKDRQINSVELDVARRFIRKPIELANFVYANQNGNGNVASGDGWRFRGRGAIQLTGRANYQAFANYVKDQEVMTNPDIVSTKYFFKSADFFFDRNNLWVIANRGISNEVITALTRRVNGGTHGLDDRIVQTNFYHSILTR